VRAFLSRLKEVMKIRFMGGRALEDPCVVWPVCVRLAEAGAHESWTLSCNMTWLGLGLGLWFGSGLRIRVRVNV